LYYKLDPAEKEAALKEWADLKSLAGKKQVVGIGSRWKDKGTVRKSDDKPANPDVYPIGFGLTKIRKDQNYPPIKDLLKAHSKTVTEAITEQEKTSTKSTAPSASDGSKNKDK
jgi:hypothetical protein